MELRQSQFVLAAMAGAAIGAIALSLAPAVSASPAEGQKLAFTRGTGNCVACHEIKGGTATGNIGPPLNDMKKRFPDRNELVAIVADETKRNPLSVMPPFKRNLILDDKQIEAIVDFLYTL